MTGKPLLIGTATLACTLGAALVVPPAASAATPRDRVVDRAFVDCSRGSMLQVDLERESRKFEVDVEIYASPRERWTEPVWPIGVDSSWTSSTPTGPPRSLALRAPRGWTCSAASSC